VMNAAAEQLLGWREAELRGREASTVLQGQGATSSGNRLSLLGVLRSGMTVRNDQAILIHKDGTTFPVGYSVAPIIIEEQVVGAVLAFHDQTEVQRLHQMQEDYLTLISHDLRSPLTAIIGRAQLLLRQLKEVGMDRARRSAEAIVTSGVKMERLLEDVLDRSQLQAGRAQLRLAPICLAQFVTRSIDQNLLPGERARIEIEAVGGLEVIADPTHLERVIVNVLSNACKYSPPSAPVLVRVFKVDDDVVISVTDQGVGIGADDLPRLFEKHFRAATAGTAAGAGLGLYGSRLIMEAHGGRIWVESTVGAGSTFLVSLPFNQPSSRANDPEQTSRR